MCGSSDGQGGVLANRRPDRDPTEVEEDTLVPDQPAFLLLAWRRAAC